MFFLFRGLTIRQYVCSLSLLSQLDLCLSFHRPSLPPLPLFIMTESPLGLLHLPHICHFATHSARHLRLSAVVFGSDDYLASIGTYVWTIVDKRNDFIIYYRFPNVVSVNSLCACNYTMSLHVYRSSLNFSH